MGDRRAPDRCLAECGHTHYGRCLPWRCHCDGADAYEPPTTVVERGLTVVPPLAEDELRDNQ